MQFRLKGYNKCGCWCQLSCLCSHLIHVQFRNVFRKEVNRNGLVTVTGVRIVIPPWQLRGRVTAKVLLVRVVERVAVLGVTSGKNEVIEVLSCLK